MKLYKKKKIKINYIDKFVSCVNILSEKYETSLE